MLCHLDQPGQDRIGIDLEHPGHGTNAQALSQRAHRPHQHVERDALAMQRRAMGLLKVAATAGAMQLAPGTAVGVAVGTDIAEPYPASIVAVGLGAEVERGVHLARPSPRGHNAGWRAPGRLEAVRVALLTGSTGGRAGEARKRLRVAGALAWWQDGLHWSPLGRSALARPSSMQHEKYPEQSQQHELIEKKVWNHGKVPSRGGEIGGFYLILGPRELSAAYRYTTHLMVNDEGELLAFRVTTGAVNDQGPVGHMARGLWGQLFGDRGYISRALHQALRAQG